MTTVAALATFGSVTAASAAPGDDSNATGTFLGGSILGLLDLDALANLEGAAATNAGLTPVEDATEFNTLDLSVLGGVVTVTSPTGVQIPLDLASLGVVGQYASAAPDASSVGASGLVGEGGAIGTGVAPLPGQAPGPLSVDLSGAVDSLTGPALAALVADIADVNLTVGAVSANASQAAPGAPVGDYSIADADLTIQSATIGALSDDVEDLVGDLQVTLDGLQTTLNTVLDSTLGALGLVDASLTIETASLTSFIQDELNGEITSDEYPGVGINLDNGTISIDLAEITQLDNLGVGEEILDGDTIAYIQDAVLDAVEDLVDRLVGSAVDDSGLIGAIRGLAVTGDATLLPIIGSGIELLDIDTTLGAILDGDDDGITILSGLVPAALVTTLVGALAAPVQLLLDNIAPTLDGLLDPVNALVLPIFDLVVPAVVSLTANNQSTSAEGVFSETALILTVLPVLGVNAVTLDLANATVGPNEVDSNTDVDITSPADGDVFTVPDEDDLADVTVAGVGQPGANVTVVVGTATQTVPVTGTGAAGTWTATFPGLPVGDYTATATQDVDTTTATVDFTVAEAPDVEILDPTDGEQFAVAGPGDDIDVPVSGTGFAGSTITVEVDVDGTPVSETATVLADGTWSVEFADLPIGEYTATATQDFDGSEAEVDFAVIESADVVILAPEDGDEIVVDGPADLAPVTVSGTGAPNATVSVTIPGFGTLTDVVDGVTGTWEVTFPALPVDADPYVATAVQDVDDTEDTVTFTVIAAEDVAITAPTPGFDFIVPDPTGTATVTVSGTGQEGETVTVTIPGQPTPAAVTVGADGEWSVVFPNLPVADYTATATQSDGSTATRDFSVVAAADLTITAPADNEVFLVNGPADDADVTVTGTGQDTGIITVTVGGQSQDVPVTGGTWTATFDNLPIGDYTATATQDLDGTTASVDFSVVEREDVEITQPVSGSEIVVGTPASTTTVTVAGTGDEGATITVTLAGQTLTDVVAGGVWSVEVPGLGIGGYTANASQSTDGSTASSTFVITAADAVLITSPEEGDRLLVADPGDVRDVIVTGRGEIGLDVDVTIPGLGVETATVSPFGTWTVTFDDVAEGDYTATAVQDGGATDSVSFEVAAAEDVEIDAPADDEEFPVPAPDSTEDVTVSGTGEPFQTITVTLDTGAELTTAVTALGTWSVTFTGLAVGDYTAIAVQSIENEPDESSDEVDFSVVAIEDVVILLPEDGEEFVVDAPATTASVTVSGTGFDGETVTVAIPGQTSLDSLVVGGAWSVTFPAVPVGTYTATATQSGDGSTDTTGFIVREAAAVTIDTPDDGDTIFVPDAGDTTPITVGGTGEPGREITVTVPGLPDVVTEVEDDGTWETTVPGVPEGTHPITAEQEGGSTTTVTVTVDEAADVDILQPTDGQVLTVPNEDDTFDVLVSGTGQPGETITLELDGEATETVVVGDDGNWTETFDDVPVGPHTIEATQSFDDSTDEVTFEIEDVTDVEIEVPADGEVIWVNGPTDTTPVEVSGTGYTGATVTVSIPGQTDQTAPVVAGEWSVTFPGLPVGDYTATASQSGDTVTATVDFSVDDRADVTITTPTDDEEILVPDEGGETDVEVCGTGQPGATIEVTVGTLPTVTTEVDEETGEWCVTVPDVPEGEHEVVAEQPDDGSETTVTIIVREAEDVTITGPADGQEIGVPGPTDTATVPVTGTGEPGQAITVVLDGDDAGGQETTVGDDGTWTVEFDDVEIGDHDVTATQEIDGSTSTVEFTVADVVVPVSITDPADGTQLTVPAAGDERVLGVAGTGDPGAEVEVSIEGVDGTETSEVADDGTWSVVFEGLGVGDYLITAVQDVDGSTDTATVSIVVGAPDTSNARADVTQPRITRGPNATQTVVATGFQPGETVSGTVNSTPFELIPVTADAFGNARFTFAVGTDFELGAHRVEIRGSVTGELPAERENTGFVVLAATSGPGSLPATGGDATGALYAGALGIALLIAGAAIYTLRRRPRTQL